MRTISEAKKEKLKAWAGGLQMMTDFLLNEIEGGDPNKIYQQVRDLGAQLETLRDKAVEARVEVAK